jgi:hypothetical protein
MATLELGGLTILSGSGLILLLAGIGGGRGGGRGGRDGLSFSMSRLLLFAGPFVAVFEEGWRLVDCRSGEGTLGSTFASGPGVGRIGVFMFKLFVFVVVVDGSNTSSSSLSSSELL